MKKVVLDKHHIGAIVGIVLILLGAGVYGGYRFRLTVLGLRAATANLASTTARMMVAETKNAELEAELAQTKNENTNLSITLASEQTKNLMFEGQIKAIGNTVGNLQKLSQTDKELLEKYSKVYFLNENYVPSSLANLDPLVVHEKDKTLQIHTKVLPFLMRLLVAAQADGVPMEIVSAYRSFGTQAVLKSEYKVVYGSGANQFSADQGYSEHQLGTTVDLTTPSLASNFSDFGATKAYTWMTSNAYQYGFVLSYPKDNEYYQFEPWHWRFVGVSLATKLHNAHQFFYDLEQREIDPYLISIFD